MILIDMPVKAHTGLISMALLLQSYGTKQHFGLLFFERWIIYYPPNFYMILKFLRRIVDICMHVYAERPLSDGEKHLSVFGGP